ncbi:MAG: hypothetical protein JXQ77_04105 [Campylobacterales bacterium]|nr:hypothetical protein [Campylobacterales bacterium]
MKKIVLSAVAVAAMASFGGASELSELKEQMEVMAEKIAELEAKQAKTEETKPIQAGTLVKSKAPVIEFSGTNYLGFVNKDDNIADKSTNKFETRRNYIQTKAYFKENPKDYVRVTLDTFQNTKETSGADKDSWEVRLKYAFLYLDEILPYTGVEIGQVHRPWIDYEEHNSWAYRSISKVFVEDDNGAHFTNSADLGINFKTKTPYFSSELGVFNGEGYHGLEDGEGLSGEWRLTGHILGTGKEKAKDDLQYANVSFFGQMNSDNAKHGDDFNWYGFHAIYNQPEFLIAAQYVKTEDAVIAYAGDGWSVNGEYRITPTIGLIARYDSFELDSGIEKERTLAGVGYKYNKNVEFIANYLGTDVTDAGGTKTTDTDSIMLTAEVNW